MAREEALGKSAEAGFAMPGAQPDEDWAHWTTESFGARQADEYADTVMLAIEALHNGPEVLRTKKRDNCGSEIPAPHVASQGSKGRHYVMFREARGRIIDVLRLLYDNMDLATHLLGANNRTY